MGILECVFERVVEFFSLIEMHIFYNPVFVGNGLQAVLFHCLIYGPVDVSGVTGENVVQDFATVVFADVVDAHIQLLEEISKVLKYKNIGWKDIKRNYYPDGLASELNDANVLRKAQMEVALYNVAETRKKATDSSGGNING